MAPVRYIWLLEGPTLQHQKLLDSRFLPEFISAHEFLNLYSRLSVPYTTIASQAWCRPDMACFIAFLVRKLVPHQEKKALSTSKILTPGWKQLCVCMWA